MFSSYKRLIAGVGALICLASFFLPACAVTAEAAGVPSQHTLVKDPSVVRYYAFDEGKGDTVHNLAGDGIGALNIHANDLYFNDKLVGMLTREEYPTWTTGRRAGTSALAISSAKGSVSHSFFYNVAGNAFTVEAWVRPYPGATATGGAALFSVGTGYDNGWKITTDAIQTSFVLGRPPGTGLGLGSVGVSVSGRLASHVWHHVVAVFNGDAKALSLTVDGKLSAKTDFDGIYTQPQPPASNEQTPELDQGGLMIGATPSSPGNWHFDVDELVIYNKALSSDVIAGHFQAGQPTASAEEQVSAHQKLLAEQARLASIGINLPPSPGYFPVGKPIPLIIAIPATAKFSGHYGVEVKLQKSAGNGGAILWQKKAAIDAFPTKDARLTVNVPAEACGLYQLTAPHECRESAD